LVQGTASRFVVANVSREVAFDLLDRIQSDDAYANLLLPTLITRAKLDSRDAAFVQELAFGTIRNWLLYEKIIEVASSRTIDDIEPDAQIVLVLGVHQLLEMRVPTHAAINESVNLAKTRGSKGSVGFVNAVLRKIALKDKDDWIDLVTKGLSELDALSIQYSHPAWIVQAFKAALVSRGIEDQLEDLLESNNLAPKVSIAALPGFCSREEFDIEEQARNMSPIGLEISGNPASIELVNKGLARVQDQGSQLVTLALVSAPIEVNDDNWLDMCAGPGGKAAIMAALSLPSGRRFVPNEVSEHRAQLVTNALAPLGSFEVRTLDGRAYGQGKEKFSRILLDAPCTGLGALRRRPESRWRRTTDDLVDLVKLQRELIDSAWEALEPGGILGYVTCSPHLSETTGQIAWAEGKFKGKLELMNANQVLNSINPALKLDESLRTAQLWPHIHGTDAMFLALMRKSIN
jgi:16S rRNA (cytosine967-C5)-methyltransferase